VPPAPEPETAQARVEIAEAALEAVKEHVETGTALAQAESGEVVIEYEARVEQASIEGQDAETRAEQLAAQQRVRLIAIEAAREKLKEQTDTIDEATNRALAEELDLEEQQIRRSLGEC
jgi:CPA1 family monovalent cation:H+ antiporter